MNHRHVNTGRQRIRASVAIPMTALTLFSCGTRATEKPLHMGEVKAALRAAGVQHFRVLPTVGRPPSAVELFGPPIYRFDGVWMDVRIFANAHAAEESTVIANGAKYFPDDYKLAVRVCNAWILPQLPVTSSGQTSHRLPSRQFVRRLTAVRDRIAAEVRARCS